MSNRRKAFHLSFPGVEINVDSAKPKTRKKLAKVGIWLLFIAQPYLLSMMPHALAPIPIPPVTESTVQNPGGSH
ncbi:hypothetical protein ACFRMQ_21380 [Kitasatospora sp. NPDC056783]|uniref:hypothetical protein n=1 Tax=Kitasatospora sp. NPDC056783 TaxID=3345943 RepID=UPI0036A10447